MSAYPIDFTQASQKQHNRIHRRTSDRPPAITPTAYTTDRPHEQLQNCIREADRMLLNYDGRVDRTFTAQPMHTARKPAGKPPVIATVARKFLEKLEGSLACKQT